MRTVRRRGLIVALVMATAGVASPAWSADSSLDPDWRFWLEGGIGGAQVDTRASELPGRRGALLLSAGIGFRMTSWLGLGFEYASSASLSGCQHWDCEGRTWNFQPAFNRATVFGEMRVLDGRVRLRYGVGDLSYCYAGGPGFNLWHVLLDSLDEYADVHGSCASVHGWVKSASIGYHWKIPGGDVEPMTAGLRLGVEEAAIRAEPSASLPAFRYRAVTLTLQLGIN